jgi:hypothetical protein
MAFQALQQLKRSPHETQFPVDDAEYDEFVDEWVSRPMFN